MRIPSPAPPSNHQVTGCPKCTPTLMSKWQRRRPCPIRAHSVAGRPAEQPLRLALWMQREAFDMPRHDRLEVPTVDGGDMRSLVLLSRRNNRCVRASKRPVTVLLDQQRHASQRSAIRRPQHELFTLAERAQEFRLDRRPLALVDRVADLREHHRGNYKLTSIDCVDPLDADLVPTVVCVCHGYQRPSIDDDGKSFYPTVPGTSTTHDWPCSRPRAMPLTRSDRSGASRNSPANAGRR
jgi:hypothetical protein